MKCYECDVDCDPPKDSFDEWWHCPKCGRNFQDWQEDIDWPGLDDLDDPDDDALPALGEKEGA